MNENRSIFWPLVLIAAGVTWLMVSMGQIPSENLWALTHIWPYALIALGVGLILRGLWRPLGQVVAALVVIGAVGAIYYAPQLGWNDVPAWNDWNIGEDFGVGGVRGSGVVKTETRKVSGFDALDVDYPAEIVITQGKSESLTIEAEDNLLPQLTTEVRDGTLHIENNERDFDKRVNPTRSIRITITVKELSDVDFSTAGKLTVNGLEGESLNISLSGAGDIALNDLELDNLDAHLSGAGKFTASGIATHLTLTISGLGNFDAPDLATQTADINISGAGSATLRVEQSLDASISGAGSITYYGSPTVTRSISGAGEVKPADE